ncbi:MAG: serine hydrolase domain-containing protein, partial [Rhodoferax sp.]|nr:serine hydrolase domain-containing protein [Rhodoferax sp.]
MKKLRKFAQLLFAIAPIVVFSNSTHAFSKEPIPAVPAATVSTSTSSDGFSASNAAALDVALRTAALEAGVVSMSAAIATRGELRWAGSYGWADIESRALASPSTRYRTGSVAKPITAMAMMRLVDRGLLELDTPLGTGIAGLPEESRRITPRQLAAHVSGIRHYALMEILSSSVGFNGPKHYASVAEGLDSFIGDRLRFAPGTNFLYSTWGYSLLSRKLELAAGSTFPQLLQTFVFEPCAMQDTAVDGVAPMKARASFYQAESGSYSLADPMDTSNRIAGGGLVSTPSDLVRLAICAEKDSFLSQAARKTMWTPVILANGQANEQNYALGWRIDTSTRLFGKDKPTAIIHHGGQQEGGASFLVIAPTLG